MLLAPCATALAGREADKSSVPKGSYHLVGVGPGDGNFMTPRAVSVLREADIALCSAQTREMLASYVPFEGKPAAGMPVKVTYARYEPPEGAGAAPQQPAQQARAAKSGKAEGAAKAEEGHRGGGMRYPVETETDAQGQAVIPVDRDGYWMIAVSHKPAYPDPETCDEYMYNHAFTFQVK